MKLSLGGSGGIVSADAEKSEENKKKTHKKKDPLIYAHAKNLRNNNKISLFSFLKEKETVGRKYI